MAGKASVPDAGAAAEEVDHASTDVSGWGQAERGAGSRHLAGAAEEACVLVWLVDVGWALGCGAQLLACGHGRAGRLS